MQLPWLPHRQHWGFILSHAQISTHFCNLNNEILPFVDMCLPLGHQTRQPAVMVITFLSIILPPSASTSIRAALSFQLRGFVAPPQGAGWFCGSHLVVDTGDSGWPNEPPDGHTDRLCGLVSGERRYEVQLYNFGFKSMTGIFGTCWNWTELQALHILDLLWSKHCSALGNMFS